MSMSEETLLENISDINDDMTALIRMRQEFEKLHYTQLDLGDEIEIALIRIRKTLASTQRDLAILQGRYTEAR